MVNSIWRTFPERHNFLFVSDTYKWAVGPIPSFVETNCLTVGTRSRDQDVKRHIVAQKLVEWTFDSKTQSSKRIVVLRWVEGKGNLR